MKIGYQNEFDFIRSINNKKYNQLNPLIQDILKALYPNIDNQDTVKAYKYGKFAKADIIIDINGVLKGISIKYGAKNSVHLEPIERFIKYLQSMEFQEIDNLLRYLYSDGTNNNTGNIRESAAQYKINNFDNIYFINQNFERLKSELIVRFLIKTDTNYKVNVDLFVIGSPNDFIWATREEVVNYLTINSCNSTSVHISNLFIQNWDKNLKYNPKYEYCRNYIQVKWYSMFDDFIKIMCLRSI